MLIAHTTPAKSAANFLLVLVAFGLVCGGAHAAIMPGAPSSAWTFDDDNADDLFGSVDGTANGNPTFSSTDVPLAYTGNKSAVFDGDDYFGSTGFGADDYNFEATDSFSVAFWIKASNSVSDVAVGKMDHNPDGSNNDDDDYRGWYVRASGGVISVLLREDWNGNGNTSNIIRTDTQNIVVDGDWTHILATYDGSEDPTGIAIYVDGVAANLLTAEGNEWADDDNHEITTSRPFGIASRNGAIAHAALEGSLDEVAIWDGSILTEDNSAWLYENSVKGIPEPGSALLLVLGGLALTRRRFAARHR